MRTCSSCYHSVKVDEEVEIYYICAVHNSECENKGCGFWERGEVDGQRDFEARGADTEDY